MKCKITCGVFKIDDKEYKKGDVIKVDKDFYKTYNHSLLKVKSGNVAKGKKIKSIYFATKKKTNKNDATV